MVSNKQKKKERIKKMRNKQVGRVKIDDGFSYGPFEVIRVGKQVIMKNNATPQQQAKILAKAREINQVTLRDLEKKIKVLQNEIARYDPLELMHFAGYMALSLLIKGKTESEMQHDESRVLPGLEYMQYLIARTVPPKKGVAPDDDTLNAIWAQIFDVLETTQIYLMTRSAKITRSDEIDHLVQLVNQMRLTMRVMRFPNFQEHYWRESLEPYDDLLKRTYGVSSESIISGLKELSEYQKRGIMQKHLDSMQAVNILRARAEELGLVEEDTDTYKSGIQLSKELTQLHVDAQQKINEAFTIKLFEITNASSLPKSILSLLSVKPGEAPLYKLTGSNNEDLSPLSTDLVHYKPFLEVDNKFYTFYHSGFEDRIAEIIEGALNNKYPRQRSSIEKARSDYIEREAIELLSAILMPDYKELNLYYPNPDDGQLTELDGLIEVDDLLFLIEVKSGGISAGAVRGAPASLKSDLKDIIFEGQRQSERAEQYVRSSNEVTFYDHTGKKTLHTLCRAKFRRIFRIVVTRESLGWIGASLVKLAVLDPSISTNMPWQVSIDDLRAITELFRGKSIEFGHYLQVRLEAAENQTLLQYDEIDHVALYNSMNYYHKNIDDSVDQMIFNGYSLPIDRYFMDKITGEERSRPEQKMPREMKDLMEALEVSECRYRFEVGSFLLGNDGNQRKDVTKHLKKVLGRQRVNGRRVIRLGSPDIKLGIGIGHIQKTNVENEKLRCTAYMKNMGLERWLTVNIDTTNGLSVTDISETKANDFTEEEIFNMQEKIERDMRQNTTGLKVARNQLCPCGSNERYKNCHGRKRI